MSNPSPLAKLTSQVAQLTPIDPVTFKHLVREVAQLEEDWSCEYGEYQSGGWKTLSLYNQSRLPQDTVIQDGRGIETSLLEKMPETQIFLQQLGLNIMSVRIARLEPQAFLWEHRDYTELEARKRLRLHIPLITNEGSQLIIKGQAIHMSTGFIWMLNPTESHGACNLGHQTRYHLLIDTYACENSDKMIADAFLNSGSVTSLPVPTEHDLQTAMAKAVNMANLGYTSSAETLLLKLFHKFSLSEGEAYNLIVSMYDQISDARESEKWRNRRDKYLGCRAYGTLYA